MFIVRSVRLSNFLSHADTRVDLDRGVTAIVGPNGAGKSSIVDAIYYALTGSTRIRGAGRENLIRRGAKEALVEVVLESDRGDRVRVARWLAASSSRPALLEVNGKIHARGVHEVSRALRGILGSHAPAGGEGAVELLTVVRQGGLPRIVAMLSSPRELREFLEDVLGVTAYRAAAEKLREYTVHVGDVAAQPTRQWIARLERMAREAEEAEARALRRLSEASRLAEDLEARLAEARREVEGLREARGRLAEAERALARLAGEVERLEAEASELEARLGELRAARREYERLEAELREAERLASLAPLVAEAASTRSRLEAARRRVEELESALRAWRELERVRGASEKLARALAELEEASHRARRVSAELARARAELGEARARLERIAEAARRVEGLVPATGDPVEALRAAAKLAERLAREAGELRARAGRLRARAEEEEARARELEEKAALLTRTDGGRCPLCGSSLPREKALELARRLAGEAGEARRRASMLRREAGEAEARAAEAEEAAARLRRAAAVLEAVEPPDPGLIRGLEERVSSLQGELERLLEEERRLRRRVEELRRAAEAEAAARRALSDAGFDPDDPGLGGKLGEMLGEARRAAAELESRLAALLERLRAEAGVGDVDAAGRIVEEAARRAERARGRLGELRAAMEEAAAVEKELEGVRRALEERRGLLEETRRAVEELRGRVSRLSKLEGELERLEAEARRAREEAARHRAEAEAARRRVEEAREAARRARILVYVRELFEKRVPALLMASMLRAIEAEASGFLSSFNLDYVALRLDKTDRGVEAYVIARDGSRAPLTQLSGGERTTVAIAFLLGLNKVVSARAGFLVLDEPTAEMDEERRRALVEVIRSFAGGRGIPQLIVVTHHDDIAEAADTVCRVSKEGGVSRVTCGA